jgi:superfamily II DNA/RNA helicase
MSFQNLGLSDELLRALGDVGYSQPTPIQSQAIPVVFMGRDLLACAQTGTGKTAGFTLPMIDILAAGTAKARMPRSLILEPTRELAAQVAESFDTYGKYHKLTKALLIGGHTMNEQIKTVERGVDVLIATPGRLLDLFERGHLLMFDVKILVIDEADRMLDMGFVPEVERIVGMLPKIRNTLFFSATMPPEIRRLSDKFLMNPKEISVDPPSTTAETITQGLVIVEHRDGRRPGGGAKEKREILRKLILMESPKNALIFCNRKRDVDVVCRSLNSHGILASRLHGDMTQPARTETLGKFKSGEINIVVCSDVAARGLDIPNMSHVFNFDVPIHAEDYVHRIGRTGRAGRQGFAYTIATLEDRKYLDAINEITSQAIPILNLNETLNKNNITKSPSDGIVDNKIVKVNSIVNSEDNESKKIKSRNSPLENKSVKKSPKHKVEKSSELDVGVVKEKKLEKAKKEITSQANKKISKVENSKNITNNTETVKGLGDHVPAFLMATSPKKK